MTLSARDKTPSPSGWGHHFHHTARQRHVRTAAGSLLVPRSADDLPPVPESHVATVERALMLLADLLSDRDHQLYMGGYRQLVESANQQARELRRIAGGMLREMLGTPPAPSAPITSLPSLGDMQGGFIATTERGRSAVGDSLNEALEAVLNYHRYAAYLTVADLVVVPGDRDSGIGWYVYDSKIARLEDEDAVERGLGRSTWWACVDRRP